jgi:LMBR1 domain-containing protein 1
MVKLGNVDLFVVIAIVVAVSILLVVAFYLLVNYQHPDDKNEAYLPKAVVVFGFCLAGITVLMLPLDVANNEGYAGCEGYDTKLCGGLNMTLMWTIVFWMIPAWVFILIPWTTFYYEADDGMLMAGTAVTPNPVRKSKIAQACCNQIFVLIIVGLLFSLTYLFLSNTNIPVEAYNGAKASQVIAGGVVYTTSPQDGSFTTSQLADIGSGDELLYTQIQDLGQETMVLQVDVATFYGGLMAWLGWFLLAIFGGIGMAALPLDLILKFTQRPKHMDAVEFAECRMSIQQRVNELVDIGEQLKMEREEKKNAPTTNSSSGGLFNRKARQERHQDQQVLKAFKQAVYLLEQDVDDFQAYSSDADAYNPLIPYIAIVFGVCALVISIMWILQIVIYVIPDPPFHPLLNDYFAWFDGWFPLFGTLSVAIFVVYLLLCAIKGCFKFGLRFMLVDLHPMRPGRTYMSSFMFNIGMVLLCALPSVQFAQEAFSQYARFTVIRQMFGIQVQNLQFFQYFWTNNVFIYAFLAFSFLTMLYLACKPGDQNAMNGPALQQRIKSRRA